MGVNIDHVATLRQQRKEGWPDPVKAALDAVRAGADGITAHLREDRRHIQDDDLNRLKTSLRVPLNMEMATAPDVVAVAEKIRPAWVCLVPEKRRELTTEGGLEVLKRKKEIGRVIGRMNRKNIRVSLFITPRVETVEAAAALGAEAVEIHTGSFARAFEQKGPAYKREKLRIFKAAQRARQLGLIVNAGHGLNHDNVPDLLRLYPFNELNIGFSIIARALATGLPAAVRDMKKVIKTCAAS